MGKKRPREKRSAILRVFMVSAENLGERDAIERVEQKHRVMVRLSAF